MVADTYDPILGLIIQGDGNNNNSWGDIFSNSATKPIARAIGGINVHTDTGGTVDLSTVTPPAGLRQDIDLIQKFTGALISDLTVVVPNISKTWWFQNSTTNAFFMYVKTPSGTAIQIPQGVGLLVMGDGSNNLTRSDKSEVGDFKVSGKAAAGSGELACNGASLLRAAYPDLFTAIGTTWGSVDGVHFTLPNLTDTGRFLRSSSGSLTVGTYQANQNLAHTHTVTGAPGVGTLTTDSQGAHVHSVTDPGHFHNTPASVTTLNAGGAAPPISSSGNGFNSNNTDSRTTGISIQSSGAHVHNVTGTLSVGSLGTASSGSAEARPEAAVVLICIRY